MVGVAELTPARSRRVMLRLLGRLALILGDSSTSSRSGPDAMGNCGSLLSAEQRPAEAKGKLIETPEHRNARSKAGNFVPEGALLPATAAPRPTAACGPRRPCPRSRATHADVQQRQSVHY